MFAMPSVFRTVALTLVVLGIGSPSRSQETQTKEKEEEKREPDPQKPVPVVPVVEEYVFVEGSLPYVPTSNTIVSKLPLERRSTPNNVGIVTGLLARLKSGLPGMRLRCHFHNTRNTGLANAWAAVEAGVDTLDASIGGIGGCPFAPAATGNIPTEDLLYMLGRAGVATGVDLARAIETARWLEGRLGRKVPGLLTKAGAFPAAKEMT